MFPKVFPSCPLSKPHSNKNSKKNWEDCQTAASAQGKEEMPGACVNKLHCRIQSWKITKQLLQSFYHIWFFFFPVALMNPSEMGSSERQIPYASSPQHRLRYGWQMQPAYLLIHSCSSQHATVGSAPKIGAGRKNQLNLQSSHGSLVVVKAPHLFQCCAVIFPPE